MKNRTGRILGRLWRDKAMIKANGTEKGEVFSTSKLTVIAEKVQCKVSLKSQKATETGLAAQIDYDAKLFLTPELNVPDGAEFSITDVNGRITDYIGSRPFGYTSHQEIYLKYKDKVR